MIFWIIGLIFLYLAEPGFPAPPSLYVLNPDIEPQKDFGYLQAPILKFFIERLSSQGFSVYPLEREVLSGNLLKSRFFFDRTGKVQMELSIMHIPEKAEVLKVTDTATFEDFWVKLNNLLNSLILPQKPLPAPSIRVQKPKEEKESILSKINPFRALSKLFPRKEEPLKIKIQVPPPPQPPFFSPQISSSQPLQPFSQPLQPQPLPSPPPSQPPASGSSPWQWF